MISKHVLAHNCHRMENVPRGFKMTCVLADVALMNDSVFLEAVVR